MALASLFMPGTATARDGGARLQGCDIPGARSAMCKRRPGSEAGAPGHGHGAIGAGTLHSCQLDGDGRLACWGYPDNARTAPPEGSFSALAVGGEHSCALDSDGNIACWGDSRYEQTAAPAGRFRLLEAGNGHTCAIDLGGSPVCWGWNVNQQIDIPTVPTGLAWRSIDAGFLHTCAVFDDDSGQCWGYDGDGQSTVPAGTWKIIRGGGRHSCGIATDGTLACWGRDAESQVTDTPDGLFKAVAPGFYHACAIREDDTLACWGLDDYGQATAPPGTFVDVSSGMNHTCGIRSDGVRQCWGLGAQGQAPVLAVLPDELSEAREGSAYSVQFALDEASGGYAPPLPGFAVVDGALPPGVALGAGGLLAGTPTAAGDYGFVVEGEDRNGFVAIRGFALSVLEADPSPPQIAASLAGPLGTDGWYIGDVEVSWTVVDPQSPVESTVGCNPVVLASDSPAASFTCTATSAGGEASATASVKRDATAPTVSSAATTAANEAGWYAGPVTVHHTCADALSGIGTCSADEVLDAEGAAAAAAAGLATDAAGNVSAPGNVVTVAIDRTAPATVISSAPAAIVDSASAQFTFAGSDALSGVASFECSLDGAPFVACASPASYHALDNGGHTFAVRARDVAGNVDAAPATHAWTVQVDDSAPVIVPVLVGTLGDAGWYTGDVQLSWSVVDGESPVLDSVGCTPSTVVADTAGTTFTCSATSTGGSASRSVTVRRDATPPQLSPIVAARVLLNAADSASANASDALSGVAAAACTPLVTTSVGSRTTTCTATDAAGNSAAAAAGYRVAYGFEGFEAPVQGGAAWNLVTNRYALPLTWRVHDAEGAAVAIEAVQASITRVACPAVGADVVPLATHVGVGGRLQDLGNGRYRRDVRVLQPHGRCLEIGIALGDGDVHRTRVIVR